MRGMSHSSQQADLSLGTAGDPQRGSYGTTASYEWANNQLVNFLRTEELALESQDELL